MLLLYRLGSWDFADGNHPWLAAAGQCSIQIGSALFLASLSPLGFKLGRVKILYAIPYTIPLVVYAILFHGVCRGIVPHGPIYLVFPLLGLMSIAAALPWAATRGSMPPWLGVCGLLLGGAFAWWAYFHMGANWPLIIAETGNDFMTAVLLLFVFRRLTPGVLLGVLGFLEWSSAILFIFRSITQNPTLDTNMTRFVVMGKVVATQWA